MPANENLNLYMVDDPIVWWILAERADQCIELIIEYERNAGGDVDELWEDGCPEVKFISSDKWDNYWMYDDVIDQRINMGTAIRMYYYKHVIACSEY